jgi:hypothetical protein
MSEEAKTKKKTCRYRHHNDDDPLLRTFKHRELLMNPQCWLWASLVITLLLNDVAVVQGFQMGPKKSTRKPSPSSIKKNDGITRRSLLDACLWLPAVASAAPPITMKELESPQARMERTLFRKKPAQALRPKIELEFAVLLMKSSYDALDALDCVAMDQFQRDFFLLRSTEYEYYISQLGPGVIYQGPNKDNPDIMCPCVSDPYYFDFLSFAQYAVISREIQNNPPFMFEERDDDGVNLTPHIVRRNPEFANDKLPGLHEQMVGKAIIDRLEETFAGTEASLSTATLGESM